MKWGSSDYVCPGCLPNVYPFSAVEALCLWIPGEERREQRELKRPRAAENRLSGDSFSMEAFLMGGARGKQKLPNPLEDE